MGQVIARRFARLRDAADAGRYDESFASVPNLVVIDGGKGQLAAALEAMQATAGLPRVAVIALAKREEEVFVPGRSRADPARPPRPGAAAPAADPRRGAPLRDHASPAEARHARVRVDLRHARRHRPVAAAGDPAALRLGRPLPRRLAGGARGGAGAAGEDGALGVRAAAPHRRAGDVLSRYGALVLARVAAACRKRSVRSVSRIAVKPRTTLTAVSVSLMPTLKASSAERGAWPRSV